MKVKATPKKQQFVSAIVHTIGEDGGNTLGFTAYFNDGSFYNVMHAYTASDYEEVLTAISKEREACMGNLDGEAK